jgi:hypothetical protein
MDFLIQSGTETNNCLKDIHEKLTESNERLEDVQERFGELNLKSFPYQR